MREERENLASLLTHEVRPKRLRGRLVLAVVAVWGFSIFIGPSFVYGQQGSSVTVDFGVTGKPAAQRASGFLHSVSTLWPEDRYLRSLKPRLFRLNPSDALDADLHHRLTSLGAVIQCVISDAYGYPKVSHKWPGDNGDWNPWESLVEDLVKEATSKGLSVQWDIWNEPDYSVFWDRSAEQFNEAWKRAFHKIRSVDPTAIIVGPSLSRGPWHYLYEFLLIAKANNVVPDVVSWHDYALDHPQDIKNVRTFMNSYRIGDRPISLNEIKDEGKYSPGIIVWWLAHVEEEGADSVAYACWPDIAGYSECDSPTLDGLMTLAGRPRAGWYAHREYANISGELVKVSPTDKTLTGIAGIDKSLQSAHVLLGRREFQDSIGFPEVEVVFRNVNLSGLITGQDSVFVRAERIPDSGTAPLDSTIIAIENEYPVVNGEVQVRLLNFGPREAYSIHLSLIASGQTHGDCSQSVDSRIQ